MKELLTPPLQYSYIKFLIQIEGEEEGKGERENESFEVLVRTFFFLKTWSFCVVLVGLELAM